MEGEVCWVEDLKLTLSFRFSACKMRTTISPMICDLYGGEAGRPVIEIVSRYTCTIAAVACRVCRASLIVAEVWLECWPSLTSYIYG